MIRLKWCYRPMIIYLGQVILGSIQMVLDRPILMDGVSLLMTVMKGKISIKIYIISYFFSLNYFY